MSILREGIHNVRAFILPDGIAGDGGYAAISRAALVTWQSCHAGMLHQVYVNGQFTGATHHARQRRLVALLSTSAEAASRIEVVAVEPREAHVDWGASLDQAPIGTGRVRLMLLRSQTLPIDATFDIYWDHGAGQIDYTQPVNPLPVPVWACRQDKAGFGMTRFASGDFGCESAAAVGLGRGLFGCGPFGLDDDAVEWLSPALAPGKYRFAALVTDAHGNHSVTGETEAISVVPPPTPAAGLDIASFEPATNTLVLSIFDDAQG